MSKKQQRVFWAIVLSVTLALSAFALVYGRARSRAGTTAVTKSSSTTSVSTSTLQGNSPQDRIETELITVRPSGFEPTEIVRQQGHFVLMIEDRSGLRDLDLHLQREAGERLNDVRIRREQPDWNDVIDLHPGRYVLTETAHSGWVCHITIISR